MQINSITSYLNHSVSHNPFRRPPEPPPPQPIFSSPVSIELPQPQPIFSSPVPIESPPSQPMFSSPVPIESPPSQPIFSSPVPIESPPSQPVFSSPVSVESLPQQDPIEESPPLYTRALRMLTPDSSMLKNGLIGALALGTIAALAYYGMAYFSQERTIPETPLDAWPTKHFRNKVIEESPFDYKAHFHTNSSIGKMLAYVESKANIREYAPLFSWPQIILEHKENKNVSITCERTKVDPNGAHCKTNNPLPHVSGKLSLETTEKVFTNYVQITESLYLNETLKQTGSYQTTGLPDALTQIAARWNYLSYINSEGKLDFPLKFKEGKNLIH